MNPRFLDTGYVIALETSDDQHHKTALQHWSDLAKSLPQLVITSYVFNEIVTFFNSRNHHQKAVEIGNRLLSSPSVQLVHVDEPLFREGWHYLEQHSDKSYSLTDCISFVVKKRLGITTALTFDKHFVQARFDTLPVREIKA